MISEFEFYHGAVFTHIIHSAKANLSIATYPTSDNASYVINDRVGIYIKYSKKRLSPWRFSFQKRHQDEILEMKNRVGEVFLLLVCRDDGIVSLNFEELKKILNENHDLTEWISVARNKRQMYAIKGSDGELEFKVGRDDFVNRILGKATEKGVPVRPRVFAWFD